MGWFKNLIMRLSGSSLVGAHTFNDGSYIYIISSRDMPSSLARQRADDLLRMVKSTLDIINDIESGDA